MDSKPELTLEIVDRLVRQMRESQAAELGVPVGELDWEVAIRRAALDRGISVQQHRKDLVRNFATLKEMLG